MSEQEFQDEDTICRSMHHLSTAASHHHLHQPTAAAASELPEVYTTTKRQYPLSPSSFQEPLPKRANLHNPSSPSTGAGHDLSGFTRLPLPHTFPAAASLSPLRRTISEPIRSDVINPSAPRAFPTFPGPVSSQPQEYPNLNPILQDSVQLPIAAPGIHRTVSDPSPLSNHPVVATGSTPPLSRRPPLARNAQRSPSCDESPSTKRLRRMKERLKEMSQWWNQVVHEDEGEDDESENDFIENTQKEEAKDDEVGNPTKEAVWVEKNGECLVLHFKCPCGTVYQILLSGNNCYYKLTNF
ncbi:Unknown protein [Striga hermonthica]|uniref:Uncharacterized protein n=1 Tax=Striga hermonthica TaxID=68872 RepID=A0A9N7MXV1_STRHE|nr:Unknown protein [Striga hermonthica]